MKTSDQIKKDILDLQSKISSLQDDLKKPLTAQEKSKTKRLISSHKKQLAEAKECLKVIESGTTDQTVTKQIERLSLSLKKYKECFDQLTDLATKQGWIKSKEYKEAVTDLKKEFSHSKITRQYRLANYMLA